MPTDTQRDDPSTQREECNVSPVHHGMKHSPTSSHSLPYYTNSKQTFAGEGEREAFADVTVVPGIDFISVIKEKGRLSHQSSRGTHER